MDEILAQRSAIPAVLTQKRPRGVTDGILEPRHKKYKADYVSPAERERLRRRAYRGDLYQQEVDHIVPAWDPWAETEENSSSKTTFVAKTRPIRAPKTISEAPISLLASGQILPAVLKPKAAQSYNPDFEDWKAAIDAEGEKEMVEEQARLKAAAEEAELQARRVAAQTQTERDPLLDDASEWEGFESEYEEDAEWLMKKRPERKTPAQRNKAKRRKEEERQQKHQAKLKARDAQLKRIQDLVKDVAMSSDTVEDDVVVSEISDEAGIDDDQLRKKRYGKLRVPKKDLELVLPDELQDSLRALKPEGNLLKERFRNMMVSGRIEARPQKRQPGKKAKTKVTEKWAYKDFTISV